LSQGGHEVKFKCRLNVIDPIGQRILVKGDKKLEFMRKIGEQLIYGMLCVDCIYYTCLFTIHTTPLERKGEVKHELFWISG